MNEAGFINQLLHELKLSGLIYYGFSAANLLTLTGMFVTIYFLLKVSRTKFNIFRSLDSARAVFLSISISFLIILVYRISLFDILYFSNNNVFYFYALPVLLIISFLILAVSPKIIQVNFMIIIMVLFVVEMGFYYYEKATDDKDEPVWIPDEGKGGFWNASSIYGYAPTPNTSGFFTRANCDTCFKMRNTIDSFGRRVIPLERKCENDFILFFGCSTTYGASVNDDETIPYYVSRQLKNYNAYSYSCGGWGPNQFLAHLDNKNITVEIPEQQGIVVYLMIDHHINRTIGSYFVSTNYNHGVVPNYIKDKNGNFVRDKFFINGRPLKQFFFSILSKSNIFNFFVKEIPSSLEDYEFTADMIQHIKEKVSSSLKVTRFIVFFHPWNTGLKKIIPFFEKNKIEYYSMIDVIEDNDIRYILSVHDNHLNKVGNEKVANEMAHSISAQ